MKAIFRTVATAFIALSIAGAQSQRNQTIAAAEYFINNDPGEGLGTAISGLYGNWNVTVSLPGLNIPVGSRAYVRFKSSNGNWSAPRAITRETKFANRGATIEFAEYYINTDPGKGNGVSLPNPASGHYSLQDLALRRGDRVFLRLRDSFGRWSDSRSVQCRFKDIDFAQFKIKKRGGSETPASPMLVSAPNEASAVFVMSKSILSINTGDTICVQVRTSDRFPSSWNSVVYRDSPVTVSERKGVPTVFELYQNYPNPFNPSTTIRYGLPTRSQVILTVFNTLGQQVASLARREQDAGYHEVRFDAAGFSSGVYFCRIAAGTYVETRKLLLIR